MVDILHRVAARTSPDEMYEALATTDGITAWWSATETIDADALRVTFDKGGVDMKVLEHKPGKQVSWEITAGPDEWLGTTVTFDLNQEGDWTVVVFSHAGWREPVEFMHHCTSKWGVFLLSLKSYLETGTGRPHPHDVEVGNWN